MYQYRIPPLLLVGILALLMFFVRPYSPEFELHPTLTLLLSLSLIFIGLLFIILGGAQFRKHNTTVNPIKPEDSSTLVSTGIYRISRNPMYVGFLFILLGWGAYLQNAGSILLTSIFFFYMNTIQIPVEEKALVNIFGDTYQKYKQHVRRWL